MNKTKSIATAVLITIAMIGTVGITSANTGTAINVVDIHALVQQGKVITPFGIVDKSSVHEVKSGSHVDITNDVAKAKAAKATSSNTAISNTVPKYGGWAEDAWYYQQSGINDYSGNWIVPSLPTSTGSLIYLFPALEPSDGSSIMQPVLQWGNNGVFGGDYWTLASWVGAPWNTNGNFGGNFTYSTPVRVNVGDTIYGEMYRNPSYPTTWTISSIDSTINSKTILSMGYSGWTDSYTYSFVTLEPYNITSCSQLPGATSFTNLNLHGTTPSWLSGVDETAKSICSGLNVNVISPTQVTLNTGNGNSGNSEQQVSGWVWVQGADTIKITQDEWVDFNQNTKITALVNSQIYYNGKWIQFTNSNSIYVNGWVWMTKGTQFQMSPAGYIFLSQPALKGKIVAIADVKQGSNDPTIT